MIYHWMSRWRRDERVGVRGSVDIGPVKRESRTAPIECNCKIHCAFVLEQGACS